MSGVALSMDCAVKQVPGKRPARWNDQLQCWDVELTQGQVTHVDDKHVDWIIQNNWMAAKGTHRSANHPFHVQRYVPLSGNRVAYLHREIAAREGWGISNFQIDHKNGCALDNRVANLRVATPTENARNRAKRRLTSSRFKGVSLHKSGKWQANIGVNGKMKYLGVFLTEEEAYSAYCAEARKHFGEFFRERAHGG